MQERIRSGGVTLEATCKKPTRLFACLTSRNLRRDHGKNGSRIDSLKRTRTVAIAITLYESVDPRSTSDADQGVTIRAHHQTEKAPKSSLTRGLFLESWW